MNHAVQLEGVTKTFREKIAVDQLHLAVPTGSIYGFVGPNGSGKTTTLRLMLRIFQPDAGRVTVLGVEQGSVADDRVGYLPEERGLYQRMKAVDLIIYFARLKGFYDCRPEVDHWLERIERMMQQDVVTANLIENVAVAALARHIRGARIEGPVAQRLESR